VREAGSGTLLLVAAAAALVPHCGPQRASCLPRGGVSGGGGRAAGRGVEARVAVRSCAFQLSAKYDKHAYLFSVVFLLSYNSDFMVFPPLGNCPGGVVARQGHGCRRFVRRRPAAAGLARPRVRGRDPAPTVRHAISRVSCLRLPGVCPWAHHSSHDACIPWYLTAILEYFNTPVDFTHRNFNASTPDYSRRRC
jgi:hypothetical protein